MGSSCSSGSKKDRCSKKKKRQETNGGNHSQRGSSGSVYVLQGESAAAASTSSGAGGSGMAGPSTPTAGTVLAGHEKARVERVDSTSVSSPMSPNQLLTRQASREGTELEVGRVDLQTLTAEVRSLLTGNELRRLKVFEEEEEEEAVVVVEAHESDVFQPSCRCLNVVLSRYEMGGPADEVASLEKCVEDALKKQCRRKGYEVEWLVLEDGASYEDWGWVCDERNAPLTIFLLVCSESARPPEGAIHAWSWLAEQVISKANIRWRTLVVWKHLIQSPHEMAGLQQRLLEAMDEGRILKSSLMWSAEGDDSLEGFRQSMKMNLWTMMAPMVDTILDENEHRDPTALNQPQFIGLSCSLYLELVNQFRLAQHFLKLFGNKLWPNEFVHEVDEYVWGSGARKPLVLHGSSGKSCLMAYLAHRLANSNNAAHVVFRIIPHHQPTRFLSLFKNLIEQCCLLLAQPKPISIQAADLPGLLRRISPPDTPLLVLLDGLDSVLTTPSSFDWLPTTLPDNVRVIITLGDSSPFLAHLRSLLPSDTFLQLPSPCPSKLCDIIIKHLCNKQMELSHPQQLVCHGAFNVNPSLSSVPILISAILLGGITLSPSSTIESSLETQAEVLLASLEEELEPQFISMSLSFLLLVKQGLSQLELASILTPAFPSLPPLKLIRSIRSLKGLLQPALIGTTVLHSTSLFTLTCPHFRSAIRKRYLESQPQLEERLRSQLCQLWQGHESPKRKCAELSSDQPLSLQPSWFLLKLSHGNVDDLIEELKQPTIFDQMEVDIFVNFLKEVYQVLEYDGGQFFTQVHGRHSLPNQPSLILTKLLDQCSEVGFPCNSFLNPVGPGTLRLKSTCEDEEESVGSGGQVSTIHRVKDNPGFMVSLNVNLNEVVVWDVYQQKAARKLRGIPQPRDIKFIDDHRALILCNRELCIYNMDEGTFEVKLKGVMNQKMPFYGLHDTEHVVALSRNRMYVNMINLSSGDCVATFKVGEDRFLNSLLVSSDGSICVCGDETQKPFPLLVWDLNSRKLMYDLRVPHHDFVTSLSAITSDGHYVICVCQEVSDPTPNFVIVYDLQNGTLFKKWKPEVSTCSVAISSEGGCAITGLTNTSLLVWDLITGACRFTLVGHTAPVTSIQLDTRGQRCLTADLPRCRDPAIRLWDLAKGACLASFASAESYITSCQLSLDGQYVVLSLSDRSTILTLMLVETGSPIKDLLPTHKLHYGQPDNDGKIVDLANG